jgi:hypothetical protein
MADGASSRRMRPPAEAPVGDRADDPRVVIATTTWNSVDIIEDFLDHHRWMGAAAFLVMDYRSTDGTREILAAPRWKGSIHLFDLPSMETDTSNELLDAARNLFPDAWCLFCDPDEFLVTTTMRIGEPCRLALTDEADAIVIPRRNMTTLRSRAQAPDESLSPSGALTLRIDGRHARSEEETTDHGPLRPPWIFTAIHPKVLVRLSATAAIGEGDHEAAIAGAERHLTQEEGCLLHYPFRSFDLFEQKVELAARTFEAVAFPPGHSWQYRRWLSYRDRGLLQEEYLEQFIADDDLPGLVRAGAVVEDTRVRDFRTRRLGTPGSTP